MDRSNGYEGIAPEFLVRRGSGRSTGIGVNQVRKWCRTLPPGAAVIDLGCGPGFPITEVLVAESLNTFGVDAAPSFVQAFKRNLPNTPVVCEAIQDSRFFNRTFDGVLAWGLMFLLSPEDQRHLIERIAGILVPGGRLLFTALSENSWKRPVGAGLTILGGGLYDGLGGELSAPVLHAVNAVVNSNPRNQCE